MRMSSPMLPLILAACAGATAPSPRAPSARFEQAMVYDAARHQVLMYGGMNAGVATGDLWAWDGTSWVLLADGGPPARFAAMLVYDPGGQRVLLYGGTANGTHLTDLWSWDGHAWTRLSASGGPELGHAAAGWDGARNRLVIHRGWSGTAFEGDTWEWNGTAWSAAATTVPDTLGVPLPSPMVYNTLRHALLMLVGDANSKAQVLWQWNGTGWSHIGAAPSGDAPAAFTQVASNDLVMLAASMATWRWNGSAWTNLGIGGPSARFIAKMVWDPSRNQAVLFGGMNSSGGGLSDTWTWNGVTWMQR